MNTISFIEHHIPAISFATNHSKHLFKVLQKETNGIQKVVAFELFKKQMVLSYWHGKRMFKLPHLSFGVHNALFTWFNLKVGLSY